MTSESRKINLIGWFLFWVGMALDLFTKKMFFGQNLNWGIFQTSPLRNYGLISGLDFGFYTNLGILVFFGLLLVIYFFIFREGFSLMQISGMAMVMSGALSNIIDRLIFGYVRDWLSVGLGFSFNFADVLIVIGAIIMLVDNKKTNRIMGK
jgi:signal peptidase II